MHVIHDLLMFGAFWWLSLPAFFFSPSCLCCGQESCEYCSGTTEDRNMQVAFADLGDFDCADCDTINGTHTLTPESACKWSNSLSVCGGTTIELTMSKPITIIIHATIIFDPGVDYITFSYGTGSSTDVDCSSFSGLDMPLETAILGQCSGGSASCALTSL